ncbi:MAG: hypothetical protein F9K29_06195 [Hyphomicrobiaceae bacterium]|nr:MAG: hypothetical protein F9K29_06195 [Hyphomicrobiaceae bacterium]
MNKSMIAGAAAALASATLLVSAAEAGGRHGGHHHHRFFFRAPITTYTPPAREVIVYRRAKPVVKYQDKAPVVKYADGKGRQYDLVSKVWFDGKNQCWSGKQPFVFKGGSWFYGSQPWRQVDGAWQTSAADAPSPVSCEGIAAFAAKIQPAAQKTAEPAQRKTPAPAKTAEVAPVDAGKSVTPTAPAVTNGPKVAECKKYFPSVGEMVAVPCTE